MKRMPLMVAIVITAFTLGLVVAVARASSESRSEAKVAELEQEIQDQKLVYAEMISEANTRLSQANTLIEEKVTRSHEMEAKLNAPAAKISMDDAISLAMTAVGQAGAPASGHAELVDYNGTVAYEVKLPDDTKVYLDSIDGHILYNSLTGGPGAVIDDKKALFEAVTYMQGGQVVSVEKTTFEEKPAFLVIFNSGDQVYVSLGGEVLSVVQPVYNYSAVTYDTSDDGGSAKKSSRSHKSDDHEDEHENESEDD